MHELEGSVEMPRLILVSGRGLWCCALPSFLETLDRSLPNWHNLRDAPLGCAPTPRIAYRHWKKVVKRLKQEEDVLLRERMRLTMYAAPRYFHPCERVELEGTGGGCSLCQHDLARSLLLAGRCLECCIVGSALLLILIFWRS